MLSDRIRSLFQRAAPGQVEVQGDNVLDPLHLAACALLLDIAFADGEFSPSERTHIEQSLERHFALSAGDTAKVMALAEEERLRAVDHFAFTSALIRDYDTGQKLVLAEVMWGVALADGQIAEHEHYLTRKISNLLNLEPGYLSAAKQAAALKKGDDTHSGPGGTE